MRLRDWIQLGVFVITLFLLTRPLGDYLEKVFSGKRTFFSNLIQPFEFFFYKFIKVDPKKDQPWSLYALHLLIFTFISLLLTYAVLRLQAYFPLNPANRGPVNPDLALNIATSFATNTNWQAYAGETTLSYFSQMVALVFQNFVSASVGISASIALIRGLSRREARGIGNFWVDLLRGIFYLLIPLSLLFALFFISQGVIQNFLPYQEVITLEDSKQTIAQGPVASQVAIKLLGSNGGGFFNANAAHPYENPTPLSNFVQMLSIFLIPSALVYLLGKTVKNMRHGWSIWTAMLIVFLGGVLFCAHFEYEGNPAFFQLGCGSSANWEGKETRFGIFNSAFFATVTTSASCGATNSMHDSFTPLGGLVPLVSILLGEIIFGGVGSGLYGMLMYVILTVFIAGLMVGRTPEYLGKKIEAREVQYVMLALVVMALSTLGFTAWGSLDPAGLEKVGNPSHHGFSEIFYAYASGTGNNGSAFGGLSANSPFWNLTMAFAMFFGRYFMMIPLLAVAGSMAKKKIRPSSEGTFPIDGPLFIFLLISVIGLVGALTYFPAVALGPISEQSKMAKGMLN